MSNRRGSVQFAPGFVFLLNLSMDHVHHIGMVEMITQLFREGDAAQIERVPTGVEIVVQRVEDQLCAASGRKSAPAIVGVCVDLNLKPAGKDAIAARSGDELAVVKRGDGDTAGEKVGCV